MPSDSTRTTLERAARDLSELRHFPGAPKEFWPRLLGCLAHLTAASHVTFVIKDAAPPGSWKKIGEWSANEGASRFLTAFVTNLENVADHGAQDGQFFFPLEQSPARGTNHFIVAVRLKLLRPEDACVAAFLLSEVSEAVAQDNGTRRHIFWELEFGLLRDCLIGHIIAIAIRNKHQIRRGTHVEAAKADLHAAHKIQAFNKDL